MKKSQIVSAIKTILAENTKQKLQENTIREMIREILAEAEEWKQFGRSMYKIELNDAGDRVVNLFSGEEILVQKKGEQQRTDDEITNDIQKTYKPSDDTSMGYDADVYDAIKYSGGGKFSVKNTKGYNTHGKGTLGQIPYHLRPSDEPT